MCTCIMCLGKMPAACATLFTYAQSFVKKYKVIKKYPFYSLFRKLCIKVKETASTIITLIFPS